MSPKKKRSNKRTGVSVSDRPAAQAENEPARSLPPTPSNPVSMPVRRPWADHSDSAVSARPADTPTRSEFGFPYKVEDLELNQFKAQAENEPVRRLGQPNSAIMPVERPLVRLSENLMLAMPVDDNSTRRVFGAAEDPFDTIVYQSNDMEFDTESGTELDEAREDSWKFEATAWSGPIEPATTSPHDSATGIEIPATPGTGTQPLPLPKLNETGSRDPRHSPLHNAETPSPEYVSTFSPENSSHSDHHRIQTEECIDPRNIEENHNPQPNLLLELYTMRMKYLVARNDELERSLARMDELECIDPHPADGRHSPQLNDLSGSHNSKSKCPMCGNEGLECINQPTLEGNHDHHLGRLSDRQTARSKHLITRNEEPGRLSYKQRKKLNTLLCVIYKFPIMLLLLVAAMVNVHEPLPNGLGESGVSSSSTSSSILLPAYLSYPLGRTRGLQAMLTSGGRPRLRQPDCDPQFEITTDNPACHEDNCLGLNIQKRCMQMDDQWYGCPCWLEAPGPRKPCPFVPPWPEWRLETVLFFGESLDPNFWSGQVQLFNADDQKIYENRFYPGQKVSLHTVMGSFYATIVNPGERHKMMITWSWNPHSWNCEGVRKGPRFIGGPGIANGLVRPPGSIFYALRRSVYSDDRGDDGPGQVPICIEDYKSQPRTAGVHSIRWSCTLTPQHWIGI